MHFAGEIARMRVKNGELIHLGDEVVGRLETKGWKNQVLRQTRLSVRDESLV